MPAAQILAGEMHYPRIPPQYWRARLQMAKAMGLQAVSAYVFWNVHEEVRGTFRFEEEADIAAFLRTAQQEGLAVLLRPGPYVCAEWDFGGLPAWLLREKARVRTTDPVYMQAVRTWLTRLGEELAPLHMRCGGPIVAVQLENEYGAFGEDAEYLRAMRDVLLECGFDGLPVYTIDQPGDLHRGAIDEACIAVTFAPGDAGAQFARLRELRPNQPLLCGEFWAGWFDHWGAPHAELDDALQVADIEWMLREGVSFNVYMFHGGTNFALWNGANAFDPHRYQPTVTSYDYQAALDERGAPREKYFAFRDAIARHTGIAAAQPPHVDPCIAIAPFVLDRTLPLDAAFSAPVQAELPLCMEDAGGSRGYVIYEAQARKALRGPLHADVRDYAVVLVDGLIAAVIDRREAATIELDVPEGARIRIVVENGGRINYGPQFPRERKGIIGPVRIGEDEMRGWSHHIISPDLPPLRAQAVQRAAFPCFLTGTFDLQMTGDTFLDVRELRKGAVWINGRCAGRVWEEGPQRDLYVPGCWLRRGANEIVALELLELRGMPKLAGGTERLWSKRPR